MPDRQVHDVRQLAQDVIIPGLIMKTTEQCDCGMVFSAYTTTSWGASRVIQRRYKRHILRVRP
jgi:hypothetical protein